MAKGNALIYALKFMLVALIFCVVIAITGLFLGGYINKRGQSTQASVEKSRVTVVIDAGHGGEDAGAVASDGTLEKDLNLDIANLLCALFELNGTEVKMTRTTDTLLYDYYGDLDNYKGQKKVYDLKNRLKIANEYENPLYIGIHMNKFSIPKYSGMQIYYSPNSEQSYNIASTIKSYNALYLQKENSRQVKKADSSIYILDKISSPAVLVECGFLSNEKELESLKSKDYQAALALILFTSCANFT